ncbi:stress responsive protein [Clostridia bacterium]|nr:stress responsive protein [Clostridia bacterium]
MRVRHIVMWSFHSQYTDEENQEHALAIKEGLEGLYGKIPGLLSIKVIIAPLGSSNRALMLDSMFEDEAALKNYQSHPAHKEAQKIVHGAMNMDTRICYDYEITESPMADSSSI